MHVILLNGPPSCGKDTVGKALATLLNDHGYVVNLDKFAAPIKEAMAAFIGLDPETKETLFETTGGKQRSIYGYNCRKSLIDFSESFAKPRFGTDIFGRLLLTKCIQHYAIASDFLIVTDSGFVEEAKVLADNYTTTLVTISRDGCSYSGDSRSDVNPELVGCHNHVRVTNDGSILDASNAVLDGVFTYIKEQEEEYHSRLLNDALNDLRL